VMSDWMESAECRGMDPELFHPTRGEVSGHIKAVCRECPVIHPCREMGIDDPSLHGVWGGLSERERRVERHRRSRLRVRAW
jgi:WhiB family transcriptional regulator, redox-sensing transcriptional regulator